MSGKRSRENIQKAIIEILTEIGCSFGLHKLEVTGDNNMTSIYVIGTNALEIEVDWHDNSLFMYVVRIIDGKLPDSGTVYRYDDGSWCRKYIDDIFCKTNSMHQSSNRTEPEFLLDMLEYYRNLIAASPDVLLPFFMECG